MKRKVLKILLIIGILSTILFSASLLSKATETTKNGLVIDSDIIYRILPNSTVQTFENLMDITIKMNDNSNSGNSSNGDPTAPDPITVGENNYTLYDNGVRITDNRTVIKTGMELRYGGSVEPTTQVLSVIGDLKEDGKLDALDLTRMIKHIIGISGSVYSDATHLKAADINKNGNVEIGDLTSSIKYIVSQDSRILTGETIPVDPTDEDVYQLSLTLRYYENITENSGSTPSGVSDLSPLEYMEYPESTIVAIDGETYDLTGATLITVENGNSTWRTAEKTYTLNVNSGSIIGVTTDGGKDITWNYNNSELSESRAAYLQMPNKNTSITIENKKYDTYTDNNIREITGDIVTNPTGVKELTLRLNDYGTYYWYSSIYANTFVSVDGIRYDTGDATVDPDKGMASKEYTIKVKPGAIISVLGYNIVQDGDSSHAEEISWKVKGQNICTADGISFKMPDKNATLEISNGKDSDGAVDNSIRNITGDFDTNILDGTRVLDLELVRYINVDGDILLSVSETSTLVNVNGTKLDLNNDTYTTEKVKISKTKSKNVGILTRTYKFYFQPEGSIKITANKETSNQAGFGMERNKNCRWYYNDNSIGNFDSKAQVSSKLVNRDIQLSIKNRYTADGELIIQDNYRDINGTAGLTFE